MMVRSPDYHGHMLAQALLNAAAQQLARHVMQSRLAVQKQGIPKVVRKRSKGRRR